MGTKIKEKRAGRSAGDRPPRTREVAGSNPARSNTSCLENVVGLMLFVVREVDLF